jgi:Ca2+-binding RTX toxin-like protein
MANMTPQEQLMLELINRARMDPNGEARRYGIALNEGVAAGEQISSKPKQVLAGNDSLATGADNHSKWMLGNDVFSHFETAGSSGFTGVQPGDRMTHAGYTFSGSWANGENIAVRGTSAAITTAMQNQFILDQHEDLFVDATEPGRGHRINILNGNFEEVGIGQQIGTFTSGGKTFNSSMITQDFATSGDRIFITGVVYNDTVKNDNFFSIGEQVVNRTVSSTGAVTDTTGAGGGYELLYGAGGKKIADFALASGHVTVGLTLGSTNAKVDVVNGREVWSDTSISSVSGNVTEIHALGIAAISLSGASSSQKMFGNSGANTLKGNAGNDTLDGGAGIDKLYGGTGHDTFVFARGDTGKFHAKADTIYDFKASEGDTIDLTAWDANANKSGRQDFHFIGSQDFHDKAGELHFIKEKSDTWIEGDTNGDGKADFTIHLDDAMTLKLAQFDL